MRYKYGITEVSVFLANILRCVFDSYFVFFSRETVGEFFSPPVLSLFWVRLHKLGDFAAQVPYNNKVLLYLSIILFFQNL